jgi:hypothetical protein
MERCRICNELAPDGEESNVLTKKGSDAVNRASVERGNDLATVPGEKVHAVCRRTYCKDDNIKRDIAGAHHSDQKHAELRSHNTFDFQDDCLFCGNSARIGLKRKGSDVFKVRTTDFKSCVLQVGSARNDEWSSIVSGRLASVDCLPASEALYHKQCYSNYMTEKNVPRKYSVDNEDSVKKLKLGRPEIDERTAAFLKVVDYLEENDDSLSTINDLVKKMTDHLINTGLEAYSRTHMKRRIQEHFGNRVIMTSLSTKECVITLRDTASSILHAFHLQNKPENPEDEKLDIIKTAAKLIVSDVKSMKTPSDSYPSSDNWSSIDCAVDYIPSTLQTLLRSMFAGKDVDLKLASIGQAIVQAIRPRAILAPLQLALGVQLHHHFASRFLVDTLKEHGFSCSYAEVKTYERSAAVAQGTELTGFADGSCLQFIADNVDHNVATLDGRGTFHGMGIIATITPQTHAESKPIPRVQATAVDIAELGRINVEYFKVPLNIPPLIYQPLVHTPVEDSTSQLDLLWKSSLLLHSPRPSWSGMMQLIQHGPYPGKSCVQFLPMIDLDPSDYSCIYSTLKFVASQARKYNVTPVLTFDQPLYWKALTIIRSQSSDSFLKNVVLRLGAFHTEMSFLGSIGHLMAGSGLQEVLELSYAGNTVSHMMTGKAVSRAVRGHMLIDAALNTILIADAYNVPVPTRDTVDAPDTGLDSNDRDISAMHTANADVTHEDSLQTDLTVASTLYDKLMSATVSLDDVCSDENLERVKRTLNEKNATRTMRTSLLWLQYMEMVDILRRFLKAERTGNWALHLQSVREMLPYLAASGHNLYTKSAHVYLQMMSDLPETHPDVYKKFDEGYHVVRRSDRYWAGLSTDLIIEQVLMRSLKTCGGLTRGKGMTETQRLLWVLSMPACAHINEVMQKLTGVLYQTSEQHRDTSQARQVRDVNDTLNIISFLRDRDPFVDTTSSLFNIANGLTAQEGVNVERSRVIGDKILASMVSKSVEEFTFRKANQAVTFGSNSAVKIKGQSVKVDPQLIFQRLVFVGERMGDLVPLFKHELCGHPPALFDEYCLPLTPNKPALADALWKLIKDEQRKPSGLVHYILDGGALLHRLAWQRGSTYDGLSHMYVSYVLAKYGTADVVFDGYNEDPTTKDVTHMRRTSRCAGVTVNFTGSMIVQSKKDEFLNNATNKQRFLHHLSTDLVKAGCRTHHATHDADVLIVQTAVASSRSQDTVLVGDDTDLLVLLLHHVEVDSHELFFAPEPKQSSKKNRIWCVKQTKESIGPFVSENILFAHAVLGSDTTSRPFGLGKGLAVNKLRNDAEFRQLAEIFIKPGQEMDTITEAGEKALVALYGGDKEEGLDALRYRRFSEKVMKSSVHVEPQMLPPSSAAARYHSHCVYYQVMEWRGELEMDPTEWGWHVVNNTYMPTTTDLPAAPSELLDIIFCGCRKDCSSRKCSCRKYGIACTSVCSECRGTSCSNSQISDITEENVDSEA